MHFAKNSKLWVGSFLHALYLLNVYMNFTFSYFLFQKVDLFEIVWAVFENIRILAYMNCMMFPTTAMVSGAI